MTSTQLRYPKVSFNVDEMNPCVFSRYWSGLPTYPLLPGIVETLSENIDESLPDVEITRIVRDNDGVWHIESPRVTVSLFCLWNSSMDSILRVQKLVPDSLPLEDWYQVTYSGAKERLKALLDIDQCDDSDVRWLITQLHNAEFTKWAVDNCLGRQQAALFVELAEENAGLLDPFETYLAFVASKTKAQSVLPAVTDADTDADD